MIMAAESSVISVACDTDTVKQSTSSRLQQDDESCSQLNTLSFASQETIHQSTINRLQQDDESCSQLNTLPSASQESSYCNQPRKRRQCSWMSDQHVLKEPSSSTQINLSANENTCAFVGWPQTFAFSSYKPIKPLEEFNAKKNFTFTENFKQRQRKGALRSNVGSSVNNLLGGAMLPPIAGIDDKRERKNTKTSDDFSKEIHEAIDRLESLIPSFQKLVIVVETPIIQQNAGKLELRNNSNSNSEDDEVNRLGMTNVLEVTKNDVANAGKYDEHSEYNFCGEVDQNDHHHHHHNDHHHHTNDRDESDLGRFDLLKRLGKFFRRSVKNDRERVKADKPQKPRNKSVVKKKQDVGHFRKLVDGLMRHKRHSKKSKKGKDDTEILGSGHHKSKRTKKKLPWLPKMGRGKVEVPNKGKAKLQRIATKTAKMVLT